MWRRRTRGPRIGDGWPSPEDVDSALVARRVSWPEEPTHEETNELIELLMLRGLRDLELGHCESAAVDLREAVTLIEQLGPVTAGHDGGRERAIRVGLARAEVKAGRVPEAVDSLTRVLALPEPHPGSESRAAVRLLQDVNDLAKRIGAQGRRDEVLRLTLQTHALAVSVAGRHREDDRSLVASTLAVLAGCYANVGDLESAVATAENAIARLRPLRGQEASLVRCLQMRLRWLRQLGRLQEAEEAERELANQLRS